MDAKKEIKKAKKELEKLEKKTDALNKEKASLQERLDGLESERKKLIEIQALQGGVQDSLSSVRTEILQVRERLSEIDEMINILESKKSELQETIQALEEEIRKAVRAKLQERLNKELDELSKRLGQIWPIYQGIQLSYLTSAHATPEAFALKISRVALKAALKTGEMAGDELLKREVAKMT